MQSKNRLVIGKLKFPTAMNPIVLARSWNEKQMKELYDTYESAKLHSGHTEEPTELQYKMAAARKSATTREVADKYKVRLDQVYGAVHRVATYQFFHND